MKTPFEIGNYLEDKGFDVFPLKKENGMYFVSVWRNGVFLDYGRHEYKTWQKAVNETNKAIYDKISLNL